LIRAILLCAGTSSRFGSPKLLAKRADGVPLVTHSAHSLMEGAGNVLAVIRPGDRELQYALVTAGCDVIESAAAARGMGASLASGVTGSPDASGWIVALGDMPDILPATHRAVVDALAKGAPLAAAVGRANRDRGHPVGFARALFDELCALDGDEGARAVVARHREALVEVPVDDPGIFLDVDTPADLARPL
jgi:molybdenum cofactor cytidylyltransferase